MENTEYKPAHRAACDFGSKTLLLAGLLGAVLTIWLLISQTTMTTAQQKAEVDLALILAVDCSHSVSRSEFDLQMVGLARAFASEEIIAAIDGNTIAVMLVQWSGRDDQIVSIPWTVVGGAASAYALAEDISAAPRQSLGKTSIAAAIDFAVSQFDGSPFNAHRHVIDISADGVSNDGEPPKSARQRAMAAGITINGLTILNDVPNLDEYFETFITGGPGSFVIRADNYEAYAKAIKLKLLREIKGQPVS